MAVVIAVFILFITTPVFAQSAAGIDPSRPIQYAADKVSFENKLSSVRLMGNVVVDQGDAVLHSDLILLRFDPPREKKAKSDDNVEIDSFASAGGRGLDSIVASGRVTVIQKKQDWRASCAQAVYSEKARTITLSGEPRLWQGGSSLTGKKIVIHLDSERVEVLGGGQGRVSGTIQPSALKPPTLNEDAQKRLDDLNENPTKPKKG